MGQALLIIDMQKGSFTTQTPRHDSAGVVDRINELSNFFRKSNYPVIYIQHDGTGTGEFEKGSPEWEILDSLQVESSDIFIDKYANDVFYRSKLQDKLIALRAQELFITGCATDFCVESTVQSALVKDFNVTVVSDGHTTADRPHISAAKVIEHYNWVWGNLIPTRGRIKVKSLAEVRSDVQREMKFT